MLMVSNAPVRLGWLGPPSMASLESTRRARALWFLSWSFFLLLGLALLVAIALTPSTAIRRGASIAAVGCLVVLLHALNRSGRTVAASWLLVLGLICIATQRAWGVGGVHAPVAFFYMMFVLMAAGLLGLRGAVIAALACVMSATALVGAELAGWISPLTMPGSLADAFLSAALALGVTLLCLALMLRHADDVAKDDIVNMFVHDMRSPLTVIMANLSMLRSDIADRPRITEHADAAIAEAVRINLMANNLLDIRRLETSHLQLQRAPVDVAHIARSVARALTALDPQRHIDVRARMPVVCECDAALLRRVLENLVSNAIKHTAAGGSVTIEVASEPACVRLSVQDEGPGVPTEARERIFERYSAAGLTAKTGAHSVGLGLAFCKLAVRAHGGEIWVEDGVPRGSRFVVQLPVG